MRKAFALILTALLTIVLSCHKASPDQAVVKLLNSAGTGGGTGFEMYTATGHKYTVTNRHMCEHGATNAVLGNRTIPLRIIEISSISDLCLLEPIIGLPALSRATSVPSPNDILDIYGFGALLPLTHTRGVFVGDSDNMDLNIWAGFVPQYTTVSILPGNSGSPVLNTQGDVVSVAFATGQEMDNRAFIVSLKDLALFLSPY